LEINTLTDLFWEEETLKGCLRGVPYTTGR
jgi:hypothetical protein